MTYSCWLAVWRRHSPPLEGASSLSDAKPQTAKRASAAAQFRAVGCAAADASVGTGILKAWSTSPASRSQVPSECVARQAIRRRAGARDAQDSSMPLYVCEQPSPHHRAARQSMQSSTMPLPPASITVQRRRVSSGLLPLASSSRPNGAKTAWRGHTTTTYVSGTRLRQSPIPLRGPIPDAQPRPPFTDTHHTLRNRARLST